MHLTVAYRHVREMAGVEPSSSVPRYRSLGASQAAAEIVERAKQKVLAELDGHGVEGSWVYYIQLGDEIKIGVSVDPLKRAQALSLNASHVLATEPGTQLLERKRHDQFRHLHLHGEWFKAAPDLLEHIAAINTQAA